jgi:hypothetical protein
MSTASARHGGLFLTHSNKPRILTHYERLREETRGIIEWEMLFDPGRFAKQETPEAELAAGRMPARFAQAKSEPKFLGGFLDVPIVAKVLEGRKDYTWVVEYDVDWTGQWGAFFKNFEDNDADLLTTTLFPFNMCKDWWHWSEAVSPPYVNLKSWHRDFHPVMRLSRRFAEAYAAEIGRPGWAGYSEFTLPTVAMHLALKVEDIGGEGPLCPPERQGQFYTNTPGDWKLAPGTFKWRPSGLRYHHEEPDGVLARNMLYHPIKADVEEWEWADMQDRQNLEDAKDLARRGKLLKAAQKLRRVRPDFAAARLRSKFGLER